MLIFFFFKIFYRPTDLLPQLLFMANRRDVVGDTSVLSDAQKFGCMEGHVLLPSDTSGMFDL